MKVLVLSTFGNYGGAAVCSKRLCQALSKSGVEVKLGVVHAYDGQTSIFIERDNQLNFLKKWLLFILERLRILFSIRRLRYLYKFSPGGPGYKLANNPHVMEADIVHLHWINFGFISINEIARLSKVKPVLWTMHDMWAFTGGCHYALTCELYKKKCEDCFYLRRGSGLSQRIINKKANSWNKGLFKLVATSHWLADCASKSTVFRGWGVGVLSTPIDTEVFKPCAKNELRKSYQLDRQKFYVLFGAVDLSDERKGFRFLLEALELLRDKIPGLHLLTFGKVQNELFSGVSHTSFGQISNLNKLVEVYNLADIFVLPSIQDNLPNTVMEAMSCGIPVVAFDCGGVNDMIDHQENGYLARNMESMDLAQGILNFYENRLDPASAGLSARSKIENNFSETRAVSNHLKVYNELISTHKMGYDL